MTLDLDELERKAKAAQREWRAEEDTWMERDGEMIRVRTCRVDPSTLARIPSVFAPVAEHIAAANPTVILALIERVRGLEKQYVTPSQWRCDGCGCVERPNDGRRPDRHDSCGGMWIRQERTENA